MGHNFFALWLDVTRLMSERERKSRSRPSVRLRGIPAKSLDRIASEKEAR